MTEENHDNDRTWSEVLGRHMTPEEIEETEQAAIEDLWQTGEAQKILAEEHMKAEEQVLRMIENNEFLTPEQYCQLEAVKKAEEEKRQKKELEKFEDQKSRSFDEIIEKYSDSLVGLYGDSYKPATRMVFYSILANQIKHNKFSTGQTDQDLRIPLLIMMKAGHGKKNYSSFIKKTITNLGKAYSEPTSYHPEQMIGKVNVDKNRDQDDSERYETVYGYFKDDFLVIDEAYDLLMSEEPLYVATLKNIREALNPIGFNTIGKRATGIATQHELSYEPDVTICLLSQPIMDVNEELLTRGSFRRFAIIKVETPKSERIKARESVGLLTDNKPVDDKKWASWIELNKILMSLKLQYASDKDDLQLIDDYITKEINNLDKTDESKEALEFANSLQFNMKYQIFRMAIVRAVVEQMKDAIIIDKRHIEMAIKDFDSLWKPQVTWISQKMVYYSDLPVGWNPDLHGWIYKHLEVQDWPRKTVLEQYVKLNKGGRLKDATLASHCAKGIDQLKMWKLVAERYSGNRNEKILSVVKTHDIPVLEKIPGVTDI